MNTRKLYCYSFKDFERVVNTWKNNVPDNVAVISIVSSQKIKYDYEKHILSGNNILNLDFDDITDNDACIHNTVLFNENMAIQSYNFIKKYIDCGYEFYIHCTAGQSRSQAFVKFILDNWSECNWITRKENPCKFPNYYVVGMLNKELYRNYI